MADEQKAVKAKDLRTKGDEEIQDLIRAAKKNLFEARFQNYTNRLNDTSRVGKLRREIARLSTIAGERRASARKSATTTPAATTAAAAKPAKPAKSKKAASSTAAKPAAKSEG